MQEQGEKAFASHTAWGTGLCPSPARQKPPCFIRELKPLRGYRRRETIPRYWGGGLSLLTIFMHSPAWLMVSGIWASKKTFATKAISRGFPHKPGRQSPVLDCHSDIYSSEAHTDKALSQWKQTGKMPSQAEVRALLFFLFFNFCQQRTEQCKHIHSISHMGPKQISQWTQQQRSSTEMGPILPKRWRVRETRLETMHW